MDDLHKFIQRNLRRIMATGALLLSLFAVAILLGSSSGSPIWMVTAAIPAGSKITPGEVQIVKANLTVDSGHFVPGNQVIVGQYATRLLQRGDLIAVTDLSGKNTIATAIFLPIGVAVNDLPGDLMVGDLVDVYVIPKDQTILPAVVAHHITIQSVDQKSRALGGSVAVSVAASASVATIIVTAESQGRLVLARDPL